MTNYLATMHIIIAIGASLVTIEGVIWRLGRNSGRVEAKLDTVVEDIRDIKTNHLPHIYTELTLLSRTKEDKNGVTKI